MPTHKSKNRDVRSRNTTPLSTGGRDDSSSHSKISSSIDQKAVIGYDELLEEYCRTGNTPSSATLKRLLDSLKVLAQTAHDNSTACDRRMRDLSRRRKDFTFVSREQETAIREDLERKERQRQMKLKHEPDARPLAVGAHALAPQDGESTTTSATAANGDSMTETTTGDAPRQGDAQDSDSSEDEQPRPPPPVPQYQTFGPDPTTFDDPTIYHIREVTDDMSEDEKKEIFGVAHYPHSDLHDLTPGTPPDRDFSNSKPPNQVSATAFINYLEPYVKPLGPEDVAFLEERGDRVNPMIVPRRGIRGYKEVWQAEDNGQFFADPSQNGGNSQNQALGSIEQMNDDVAETNDVSVGPTMARLMSLHRSQARLNSADANGDTLMNGTAHNDRDSTAEPGAADNQDSVKPPTFFSESQQPGWKTQIPKQDFTASEERLRQELMYIGFLTPEHSSDYDGHHDDDVAARLRHLQEELQRVSILNGARKLRVLELTEERMAVQEWSTIADDLDTQINQAYLKRHRNIGKSKGKLKRPGGPGGGSHPSAGGGVGKPGIGEPIRALMNRRTQWSGLVGPVVNFGRTAMPGDSIFDQKTMDKLMAKEREAWAEAQEQG